MTKGELARMKSKLPELARKYPEAVRDIIKVFVFIHATTSSKNQNSDKTRLLYNELLSLVPSISHNANEWNQYINDATEFSIEHHCPTAGSIV
jgi:hypothetical protein